MLFAICLSYILYGFVKKSNAPLYILYIYNTMQRISWRSDSRLAAIKLCYNCDGLALVQGSFLFLIYVVLFSISLNIYETKNYFKICY